ncbi:hypothetical protein D9M68_150660 [compost metagenome]
MTQYKAGFPEYPLFHAKTEEEAVEEYLKLLFNGDDLRITVTRPNDTTYVDRITLERVIELAQQGMAKRTR